MIILLNTYLDIAKRRRFGELTNVLSRVSGRVTARETGRVTGQNDHSSAECRLDAFEFALNQRQF